MYCKHCGHALEDSAYYCTNCGCRTDETPARVGKNRIVAGLLAIFLGSLGIHNFYLGYQNRAITQLLVSVIGGIVSCGVATLAVEIWALVEGIQIFAGQINVDANGVPLRD